MRALFVELPPFARLRQSWRDEEQFWLFTLYDKNEAADLTADERKAVKRLLEAELAARSGK